MRVRQTFVLEDASGDEVARIQERKLCIRDKIAIERDGHTVATVHKALVGIRDRFAIDLEHGADMKAHGNIVDHEYEIERDGDTVATISKKWFRVRDAYGVDVAAGEDAALILAITVAIDSLTTRRFVTGAQTTSTALGGKWECRPRGRPPGPPLPARCRRCTLSGVATPRFAAGNAGAVPPAQRAFQAPRCT